MATPENTLITRAQVTSIVTPTTKRFALVMDEQTIELGNTGLRDISGLFEAGKVAGGSVVVQRIGNLVCWHFINISTPAGSGSSVQILNNANIGGVLTPFLPEFSSVFGTGATTGTAAVRVRIWSGGTVDLHFAAPLVGQHLTVTFTTGRSWPTVLPGVENGQPVGV